MSEDRLSDTWERGSPYESYIGRWSRGIAPLFLAWLDQPQHKRWLDVGCGTGALCAAILDRAAPSHLVGVEPSVGFLELAASNLGHRAQWRAGSAAAIALDSGSCDVVVSGLVLNFVPDLPAALSEMRRLPIRLTSAAKKRLPTLRLTGISLSAPAIRDPITRSAPPSWPRVRGCETCP